MHNILAVTLVKIVCLLSKFGIGETMCHECRASWVLGASQRAYRQKEYGKCYSLVVPYIDAENDYRYGSIKYIAALLFYYGYGVTINRSSATKLFSEAAALGNDDAQQYLLKIDDA